jgi:hypothetical protein
MFWPWPGVKPPLGIEQDQPESGTDVFHYGTRASAAWLHGCCSAAQGIDEPSLSPDRVPTVDCMLGPIVISGDKEAARAGARDHVNLCCEIELGFAPTRSTWRRQSPGVGVVAQKHDDRFRSAGDDVLAQGLEHWFAG